MKKIVLMLLTTFTIFMFSFVLIAQATKVEARYVEDEVYVSSIDYSGKGTNLKHTPTGEAYTISGDYVIVPVYIPCYIRNTNINWTFTSWSSWGTGNNRTNITNLYSYLGDTYPEYKVESRVTTQYRSNKGDLSEYRTSKPTSLFKTWTAYRSRTEYRYKQLNMKWNLQGSKGTEVIPLKYSLYNYNGSPIQLGLYTSYSEGYNGGQAGDRGYTSYSENRTWYFTVNGTLKDVANLFYKYYQIDSTGILDKLVDCLGPTTILTALDDFILDQIGKKSFLSFATELLKQLGNNKVTGGKFMSQFGLSYLGMLAIAYGIAAWGGEMKTNQDQIQFVNALNLINNIQIDNTVLKVSTSYYWIKQNDTLNSARSSFHVEVVENLKYVSMYDSSNQKFLTVKYFNDLNGFESNLQNLIKYSYTFTLGFSC